MQAKILQQKPNLLRLIKIYLEWISSYKKELSKKSWYEKNSEKILMCIQVSQLQTESPADGIKRFNIKYIFEDGSELQLKSNRVVLPQLPGDSFDPNWIQTDLDTVEFFRNVPKNMNSHKIQKLIQYTKFQQWLNFNDDPALTDLLDIDISQ